jgi:hypothetical protein
VAEDPAFLLSFRTPAGVAGNTCFSSTGLVTRVTGRWSKLTHTVGKSDRLTTLTRNSVGVVKLFSEGTV